MHNQIKYNKQKKGKMNYSFKRENKFNLKILISVIVAVIVAFSASATLAVCYVEQYVKHNANNTYITNEEHNHNSNIENTSNFQFEINYSSGESSVVPGGTLADVVEKIMPATINVFTKTSEGTGAGSGVIVEKAKVTNSSNELVAYEYIAITNHHVISGISEDDISVEFFVEGVSKELTNTVTLVGSDEIIDIAVLRIRVNTAGLTTDEVTALNITPVAWLVDGTISTPTSLEDLSLINVSDKKLRLAEEVFIVGNPLGVLGGSVSTGIVSNKAVELTIDGISCVLNQTTSAINGGNSGGGVFNYNGTLVGIVKAKAYGEKIDNLGFFIPIDDVYQVYAKIRQTEDRANGKFGYVEGRKTLGVEFSEGYLTENGEALSTEYQEQVTQTYVTYVSNIDKYNVSYVAGTTEKFSSVTNQQSVISEIKVYKKITSGGIDDFELKETIATKDINSTKIQELVEKYDIGDKLVFKARECSTVKEPFYVEVLISQLIYNPNAF